VVQEGVRKELSCLSAGIPAEYWQGPQPVIVEGTRMQDGGFLWTTQVSRLIIFYSLADL
jgi:hypothetical protein